MRIGVRTKNSNSKYRGVRRHENCRALGAITAMAGFVPLAGLVGMSFTGLALRYARAALLQRSLAGLLPLPPVCRPQRRSGCRYPIGARVTALLRRRRLSAACPSPECRCQPYCWDRCRSRSTLAPAKAPEPDERFFSALVLAAHPVLLSSVSPGGSQVLPDVHNLAAANGWLSGQGFASLFAVAQLLPGQQGPDDELYQAHIGARQRRSGDQAR